MKITKQQLRQIIKEEISKASEETSDMDPKLEREILKMFDAGKRAAYEDTLDRRQAISLAGEYVREANAQELFPDAYRWWTENYGSWDADEMLDHWMAKRRYSMK